MVALMVTVMLSFMQFSIVTVGRLISHRLSANNQQGGIYLIEIGTGIYLGLLKLPSLWTHMDAHACISHVPYAHVYTWSNGMQPR